MDATNGGDIIPESLIEAAVLILKQPDPWAKARLTNLVVAQWRMGSLAILPQHGRDVNAPDRPARSDDKVCIEIKCSKIQTFQLGS